MNKPTRWGLRVPGTLLALALLLQGFAFSHPGGSVTSGHAARAAALRVPTGPMIFRKPACGGLTLTAPATVYRYSYATFRVSNWSGQCLTWYYNQTYTNTSTGYISIYIGPYSDGGSITAIQHSDCTPYSSALYCGNLSYSVSN